MEEQKASAAEVPESENPQKAETPTKPWTVLTFLGGENNLSDEMVFAIKEMKRSVIVPPRAAQGEVKFNFHAPVQFAAEYSSLKAPVRFEVTPGDIDGTIHANYKKTDPNDRAPCWEKDPLSYKCELVDFLYWGIKNYPAEKYFVILSGHGNGIESNFLVKETVPPQSLTIKQLREVLEHPDVQSALKSVGKKKIDIIGFDSCLMSMVEVCYELRNDAGLIVSSQGSEANLGWPYKAIFAYLHNQKPAPDPLKLAKKTVKYMVEYYADFSIIANSSADLSVCDLSKTKIKGLVSGVDGLAKAIMNQLPTNIGPHTIETDEFLRALIFAHWYAQTYRNDQYTDLFDFCDVLGRNLRDAFKDVKTACETVKTSVKGFVKSTCYTGPMYQYSNGISIYFPWSEIYPPYDNTHDPEQTLDFLKDTCWLTFLHKYIESTQRPAKDKGLEVDKLRDKDNIPRTRGTDDPMLRAKNPAHKWGPPKCLSGYFEKFTE